MTDPLDNPGWHALRDSTLALRQGDAARMPADVGPFGGLADDDAWPDLAKLVGPDEMVVVVGDWNVPDDWEVSLSLPGVQMVGVSVTGEPDAEAVRLTAADVPEMLDLVRRTEPGPLRSRTIELGTYLGIRCDGALVAMAGERFRVPGWTEISAVCTDQAFQGRGLGTRLVRAIVAGIQARCERPFLHTTAHNANAIRLYERLGFQLRRTMSFTGVRPQH